MRRRILALLLAIVMCAALSLPASAALFPTIVEKDGAYYLVDYDYETGERIESAPHAQQIIKIRMNGNAEAGWLLRKKIDNKESGE